MHLEHLKKKQRSLLLRRAARSGNLKLVIRLLQLEISTKSKTLALKQALQYDQFKIAAELYESGAYLPAQ